MKHEKQWISLSSQLGNNGKNNKWNNNKNNTFPLNVRFWEIIMTNNKFVGIKESQWGHEWNMRNWFSISDQVDLIYENESQKEQSE